MDEDMIGRTLGPYRIMEQLGIGGMATVYKAYQPSMDRTVAVKVLPAHFAQDPTFRARFEQEAKVIANLEHARILPVYDYGSEDNISYIVMRYLDAGTLSDRLRENTLDIRETSKIIGQIGEALDYAHKKGIVHRDIKPSNIMLHSNGDIYLTDFGIAKMIEGSSSFTGSAIVGTPDYMSPEQGLGQPIDHRTDIYSLGVVLYQMALGRVPFEAETPMAVVIKHINEPLPMPSKIKPGLSPAVERVILRAMAKEPEDRFENCGALAEALDKAVRGIPDPSMDTAVGVETGPMTVPLDPAGETVRRGQLGAEPATSAAPADRLSRDERRQTRKDRKAERKAKKGSPGPLRFLAFGLVLIVLLFCAFLAISVLRIFNQSANAGLSGLATELAGMSLEDLMATGIAVEATTAYGTIEPAPVVVADLPPNMLMECPEGTEFLTGANYELDVDPDLPLPDGAAIERLPNGAQALVLNDAETDGGVFLAFTENAYDGVIRARVSFPAPADIALYSRVIPDEQAYVARYTGPETVLARFGGGETSGPLPGPSPDVLFNGDVHVVELDTRDGMVRMSIDNSELLALEDPDPLPEGFFGLEGAQGRVHVHEVLVCGVRLRDGDPASLEREVLFVDGFDDTIAAEWEWFNEPVEDWGVDDGVLIFPVLPGTSGADGNLPTLVVPLPDRDFITVTTNMIYEPDENAEAAGLVWTNELGRPLLMLGRGYCDTPECQNAGDAIFLRTYQSLVTTADLVVVPLPEELGDQPIGLRLAFNGDQVIALFQVFDDGWNVVDAITVREIIANRAQTRVGFASATRSTGIDGSEAEFLEFEISVRR